jgi:hypothetical protein
VGVLGENAFKHAFSYTHEELMEDYQKKPYPEKLERYILCNRLTSWLLSSIFPKYVDFKWILPTMLYNPHIEIHLEVDVTMYL